VLAVRELNGRAGPAADELPRIALEVDGGGALAGRARAGRAVILPLKSHSETLLLVRGESGFALGLRGAAEAIVARALDRALARTSDVIVVFADIISLRVNSSPPSRPRTSVFEVFVRDITQAQVKTSESVTEQRARTFRIPVESLNAPIALATA
jgi:hypothetical protein